MGDFVHKFDNETGLFFKVYHGPCSSYFFTPNGEQLYVITMSRYHGTTDFEEQINRLTEIYTYEKAKNYHVFQKLVEENYPNPDVPLTDSSKVNQFIEKCGSVVGGGFEMLGGWTAAAVNYVGEYIEPKVAPGEMSQENKQKVEKITNATKSVTGTVVGVTTAVAEPIINKGLETGQKVSQSMETSQYSGVRALNGVATSTWNASGKVWNGFWNGLCGFGKAVQEQSSKIWNKKFYSGEAEKLVEPVEPSQTPGQKLP